MHTLRWLIAGTVVFALSGDVRSEGDKKKPDYAKLLVGKWEVTKSEKELPVGSVLEFSKDGKMKMAGKTQDATYKVVGDQLHITLLGDKQEEKDPLTIKSISESQLVLLAPEKNRTWEFKRVK